MSMEKKRWQKEGNMTNQRQAFESDMGIMAKQLNENHKPVVVDISITWPNL